MVAEYNNHSSHSSILIIGLVVVLLLLSNITTTTVLAGRWMIHDHHHHQEKKQQQQQLGGGRGGDPTTRFLLPDDEQEPSKMLQLHLDPNTLRRVLYSLNAELSRSGEPAAEFVLLPLTGGGDGKNFKLQLRHPHITMGGFHLSDFERTEAAKPNRLYMSHLALWAAANRAKTHHRRPMFQSTRFLVPDDEQEPSKMLQLHLDRNTLRRVVESLNAELIRSGEAAEFVLLPLTRGGDRKNFKLQLRPEKISGYRTNRANRLYLFDLARRQAAANTRRPIFQFRADPDWNKGGGMPESRGGGTKINWSN